MKGAVSLHSTDVAVGDGKVSDSLLFRRLNKNSTKHLYGIDMARGIAAMTVLLWHYKHFFYSGTIPEQGVQGYRAPFASALGIFYDSGEYAVHFFWMISGFVFAATYMGRTVSGAAFWRARFARLYPLHFTTLLVVAVLQGASNRLVGHFQIYPFNDAYHFLLNVFFASSWGLERGFSFNAPIWSVSIEILVYAAFWVSLSRLFSLGIVLPLAIAVVAVAVRWFVPDRDAKLVDTCVLFFFIGVAIYVVFRRFQDRPLVLLLGSLPALLAGIVIVRSGLSIHIIGILALLSGLLLAICALEATAFSRHLVRFRWIGDNTYGTYLWHVPIQIGALTLMDAFRLSHGIAQNPLFLLGFLALTMLIARLSYLYLERPMQDLLRGGARAVSSGRAAQSSSSS